MQRYKFYLLFCFLFIGKQLSFSQVNDSLALYDKDYLDSLYIEKIENKKGEPLKILHAEPLFIDLIRDLGARKGEKEWNVGMGINDNRRYNEYTSFVEYEWAPINRLGFEIELPFSFYQRMKSEDTTQMIPGSSLQSIKLATQYSFWVSEKHKTTFAIGYLHEFELIPFKEYGKNSLHAGNYYSPFFVGAKRWGQNFHTLIYTGPEIIQHFGEHTRFHYQFNTNLHYMIDGTRNFIGIEFNKNFHEGNFNMTIRPQMRVGIADNLLIGIVTGIPYNNPNQSLSSFLRLIYEPGHKVH
jgi:hypothetical protein